MDCIFCKEFNKDRIIYEDSTWVAVLDEYPVSKGHTLLIPKRHFETYFDLEYQEVSTIGVTIGVIKLTLDSMYHPSGYNIGVNCGASAGQTIPHCHIHIIPRYDGDMEDPRGGVRGVIPTKMNYLR